MRSSTSDGTARRWSAPTLFARSGRLDALGFTPEEMIARLDSRFRGQTN